MLNLEKRKINNSYIYGIKVSFENSVELYKYINRQRATISIVLFVDHKYSNILSWNIVEKKKNIWPRGDSIPRRLLKSTDIIMLYAQNYHASPKKNASSPELSNTVFSHSSNINSHIMTDAVFVM